MLPDLHLSCHTPRRGSEGFSLTRGPPFDLRIGTRVKPARHIGTKSQSYAGCRDMTGTRQPVAGSGHFDRLDILSQWS